MKRICALFLSFALVVSVATPVFAYNNGNGNGNNGYYNDENNNDYYQNGENGNGYIDNGNGNENGNGYNNNKHENGYAIPAVWEAFERPFGNYHALSTFGFIGEKNQAECGNYTLEILNKDGDVILILWLLANMRGGYAVVDSVTGYPADLSDHDGEEVLVFYGPVYTTHDIPQSNALAIIVNLDDAEYNIVPSHHTIEAVRWNETEDAIIMTVDNGDLYVTLNHGTALHPWLTRQVVTLDDFQIGDEVLLWYGMVALSYPAQTTATRALRLVPILPDIGEVETGYEDGEIVNGYHQNPELVGHFVAVGIDLYRVNLNAEARGFETVWNSQLRRAELTRGDTFITLAPGFAVFYVNGEAHTMSAPSLLTGGRLFAPADFFDNL